LKKLGWATFWAIFSQNHPVTLALALGSDAVGTVARRGVQNLA
jgi:hypothetical protein